MTIGKKISQLREESGLTQADLAQKVKVRTQDIVKWEQGQLKPNPEELARLAATFDLSVADLTIDANKNPDRTISSSGKLKLLSLCVMFFAGVVLLGVSLFDYIQTKQIHWLTFIIGLFLLVDSSILLKKGIYK